MTASNPPPAGSPTCLEGLALESLVDLSSIPSAETSQTSEGEEEVHGDPKISKKRTRKDNDPDEVTSDFSGAAKRQELDNPIPAVPLASMPPPSSSKPTDYPLASSCRTGPPRLFSLGAKPSR